MIRLSKTLLVLAVALFYTVVVFNNITDYGSNYEFVHHVLLMDSTFPGNHGMWRSVHSTAVYVVFYDSIIGWEALTGALCWWGGISLAGKLRAPVAEFHAAKQVAVGALTLSMLMWFIAFLTVGAEWFLMWQSKVWNGQEAAFRMFTVVGIVLVYLVQGEDEEAAVRTAG